MIGPSGVGKTKLHLDLMQTTENIWMHKPEVGFEKYKQNNYKNTPHFELLEKKIINISSNKINSVQKTILLKYFAEVILKDLYIQNHDSKNNYFLDEGLIHNFAQEIFMLEEKDFLELIKNKFVIYLRPDDPETVVNRIFKRRDEGGHMVTHHQGLDFRELIDLTKKSISFFDTLTKKMDEKGNKILRLTAESNFRDNVEIALDFIGGISKNRIYKMFEN
jgi:hypothetical protein